MNKIILLGRLTKDVDLKYSTTDEPVARARYTLAVNRLYKREGEQEADFINIVAFAKQAEFANKYFKKGKQVCIVGRLQISQFEDDNNKRQYYTEVIAEEQHFADSKKEVD